jgi:hypothetical protein
MKNDRMLAQAGQAFLLPVSPVLMVAAFSVPNPLRSLVLSGAGRVSLATPSHRQFADET